MTFYQLKKNDGSVGRLGFPPPYQYDAFGSKILFNLLQHQIDVANGCRGIRVILVLGDIPALAAASEFVDVANPRTRTIVSLSQRPDVVPHSTATPHVATPHKRGTTAIAKRRASCRVRLRLRTA